VSVIPCSIYLLVIDDFQGILFLPIRHMYYEKLSTHAVIDLKIDSDFQSFFGYLLLSYTHKYVSGVLFSFSSFYSSILLEFGNHNFYSCIGSSK